MPMMNALGALGYGRFGYATLPSGLVWLTVGAGSVAQYPEYNYGIVVDNAGSVIVVGVDEEFTTQATQQPFLAKLNSDGTINYSRYVGTTGSYQAAAVDSADNIYAVGSSLRTNTGLLLVKYNSAGTLQWQRQYQIGTTTNTGTDIAVDTTGNSYCIGTYFFSPTYAVMITKYDTSGTLQWSKYLQTTPPGTNFKSGISIVVDYSGNTYSLITNGNATINYSYLVKLDSTGATIWQKRISTIGFADGDSDLSISGTTLCMGYNNSGGTIRGYIQFDLSGNITKQQNISVGSSILGTCMDEDGNIYMLGQSISPNVCYITKINSAGQFVFARKLSCATVGFNAGSIAYKNKQLYVALTATNTSLDIWTLKLPTSDIIPFKGIYTITSQSVTYIVLYQNYGGTVANSSYSAIAGDLTISNSGGTSYVSGLTNGARSLIWTTKLY